MENLGVVYELDSNNCSKNYTDKNGRQLKERIKEHKNDGKNREKVKRELAFTTYIIHWPFNSVC